MLTSKWPKSVGFIHKGTWMSVRSFVAIHTCRDISVWIKLMDRPTGQQIAFPIDYNSLVFKTIFKQHRNPSLIIQGIGPMIKHVTC